MAPKRRINGASEGPVFRKKPIPPWIKRDVLKRQGNICICGCCESVSMTDDFDHHPAVATRPLNDAGTDTIPPQLDPDYIFARVRGCHKTKTYHPLGPHTSLNSDRHAIDKIKRIRKGGRKRQGPPMAGSRDSSTKHHVNGVVEWRQKEAASEQ